MGCYLKSGKVTMVYLLVFPVSLRKKELFVVAAVYDRRLEGDSGAHRAPLQGRPVRCSGCL